MVWENIVSIKNAIIMGCKDLLREEGDVAIFPWHD